MVVCNCVSNAPGNVAETCFSILKGNPQYFDNEPSSGYAMDLISTVMCIVLLAVMVLRIVLLVTQRKRFENKTLTNNSEKRRSDGYQVVFFSMCVHVIM